MPLCLMINEEFLEPQKTQVSPLDNERHLNPLQQSKSLLQDPPKELQPSTSKNCDSSSSSLLASSTSGTSWDSSISSCATSSTRDSSVNSCATSPTVQKEGGREQRKPAHRPEQHSELDTQKLFRPPQPGRHTLPEHTKPLQHCELSTQILLQPKHCVSSRCAVSFT